MRTILWHIVHCSDSPDDMDIGVEEIRQWHLGRGWDDVGYHFIIRRNGVIEMGRTLNVQGAHCVGYNMKSVGTCLVGAHDFTEAQFSSLRRLHTMLESLFNGIKAAGHRDFNRHKTCPNFDVQDVLSKRG